MKTSLTVKEFIANHGVEKTAFKLIDNRVVDILGISIYDLPDTSEVADLVEELADILHDNPNDKESIKYILNQIDFEFIERIVYG